MNYYNITRNDLSYLKTSEFYSKYVDKNTNDELFRDSGKEHYKLLYIFGALLSITGIAYELRKNEDRTNCG